MKSFSILLVLVMAYASTANAAQPLLVCDNPYEQTIEQQLETLRRVNQQERWMIPDEVIDQLAHTAPAWPMGRLSFRSLRIRFGDGVWGIAQTFEAHARAIKHVFDDYYWRWSMLDSGLRSPTGPLTPRMRLYNGNTMHVQVVEWVTFDLETFRDRGSVAQLRDRRLLADELLVFAWMFPEYVRNIEHYRNPALIAGGYMVHVPGDATSWDSAVVINWGWATNDPLVHLSVVSQANVLREYSVPVLLSP